MGGGTRLNVNTTSTAPAATTKKGVACHRTMTLCFIPLSLVFCLPPPFIKRFICSITYHPPSTHTHTHTHTQTPFRRPSFRFAMKQFHIPRRPLAHGGHISGSTDTARERRQWPAADGAGCKCCANM